jgi:glycerol-3-phosphate dehydrogenase subunit C
MTLRQDIAARRPGAPRGRAATLASMDRCTKCGLCQLYCPVSAATDRFPGPKYTGPQAERFRVIEAVREAAPALCSGCGVCTSVCPNDVAITDIIAIAKAEAVSREGGVPLRQRLVNRPDVIGRLGGLWPRLANAILSSRLLRGLAEGLTGIHRKAPLPGIQGPAFRRWLARRAQPEGPPVTYFPGCAVENYDPGPGIALIEVLNHLGWRVEAPDTACCGLPMLSSGEWAPAGERAGGLVAALAPAARVGRPILATSTSCGLTLRAKYAALLDLNEGDAGLVAGAVRDICEFLRDGPVERLAADLEEVPRRVLYHGPCQLRGHRMGLPAAELLRRVPGLDLVLSEAACCGVGGTYGYDKEKYEIAQAVGTDLRGQIASEGPDFVVCDSETCRWNIEAATGLACLHPVEVLAAALAGRDPLEARRTVS